MDGEEGEDEEEWMDGEEGEDDVEWMDGWGGGDNVTAFIFITRHHHLPNLISDISSLSSLLQCTVDLHVTDSQDGQDHTCLSAQPNPSHTHT